jgi:Type III flagellar switch regulator (C-ring) FliN C-term
MKLSLKSLLAPRAPGRNRVRAVCSPSTCLNKLLMTHGYRMVDEPAGLLLDGKRAARGEAVIVDGNYGLRVTGIRPAVETYFIC